MSPPFLPEISTEFPQSDAEHESSFISATSTDASIHDTNDTQSFLIFPDDDPESIFASAISCGEDEGITLTKHPRTLEFYFKPVKSIVIPLPWDSSHMIEPTIQQTCLDELFLLSDTAVHSEATLAMLCDKTKLSDQTQPQGLLNSQDEDSFPVREVGDSIFFETTLSMISSPAGEQAEIEEDRIVPLCEIAAEDAGQQIIGHPNVPYDSSDVLTLLDTAIVSDCPNENDRQVRRQATNFFEPISDSDTLHESLASTSEVGAIAKSGVTATSTMMIDLTGDEHDDDFYPELEPEEASTDTSLHMFAVQLSASFRKEYLPAISTGIENLSRHLTSHVSNSYRATKKRSASAVWEGGDDLSSGAAEAVRLASELLTTVKKLQSSTQSGRKAFEKRSRAAATGPPRKRVRKTKFKGPTA